MIISIVSEEVFYKTQFSFMIILKNSKQNEYKGNVLQHIKAICDNPTANIILDSEKLEVFLLKITNKTSRSTFTIIQYSTKSPSKSQLGKKK